MISQPPQNTIQIPQPHENAQHPREREWGSKLCSCNNGDEESCWWGTWCCWLLNARTAHSLELSTSLKLTTFFWIFMLLWLLCLIFGAAPLAVFFGTVGGVFYAFYRGKLRTDIRQRFGISGSAGEDFWVHLCCSCCAVCQESREAKYANAPKVDFCSGEDMTQEINAYNAVTSLENHGNMQAHFNSISLTGRIILSLCAFIAITTLAIQLRSGHILNIAILALIFVQPFLVLYFIYWRPRRQYASLDLVIKMFAVGFWFTTFQSMILESIIQYVISALLYILSGYGSTEEGAYLLHDSSNYGLGQVFFQIVADIWQVNTHQPPQPSYSSHDIGIYLNINSSLLSPLSTLGSSSNNNSTDLMSAEETKRQMMRAHPVLVIGGLVLTAYVVAAGVEETMKHFAVRCCRFPQQLNNPHAVLVFLLASALGFATMENIGYVFSSSSSPLPGTSLFVGEVVVLLLRVCMPMHLICAVLQAASLSKAVLGMQEMSLFWILLPPILLHGTFDFVLFLLAAIEFMRQETSGLLDVLSFVVSLGLTIGGIIWAHYSFKQVEKSYHNGWRLGDTDEREDEIGLNNL